jgi:hypothetical protein
MMSALVHLAHRIGAAFTSGGRSSRRSVAAAAVSAAAAAGLMMAPAAQAAAPVATTGSPSVVHFDRATLAGTVNPSGQELEECVFEYGETAAYDHSAPCSKSFGEIGSGSSPVEVEAEITGLEASTEYHFRLTVKNPSGTAHGQDQSFSTLAPPKWKVTLRPNGDYVVPGPEEPGAVFRIEAENVGGDETDGEVKIQNTPPTGLTASNVFFEDPQLGGFNLAQFGSCPSNDECKFPGILAFFGIKSLKPGQRLVMLVLVPVPADVEGLLEDQATVSGGGGEAVEGSTTTESIAQPPFGKLGFNASITNAAGEPYTQAGGHPYAFTTEFDFATVSCTNSVTEENYWVDFNTCPLYDPKDITADLPPGLIANPQGVPHCTLAEYFSQECNRLKTAVGTAGLRLFELGSSYVKFIEPVLNLEPAGEYPGQLGILVAGAPFIVITTGIRDGSDYGATATTAGIQAGLNRTTLTLWGVPAAHAHDPLRGKICEGDFGSFGSYHAVIENFLSMAQIEQGCEETTNGGDPSNQGGPAEVEPTPFLTMPTECSGRPLSIGGRYDSWQLAGDYAEASASLQATDGCNALTFEPSIESRPTTTLADAPSGLEFNLHIPQNEDPEGVATPELKEAVVRLPQGLNLNPSAAAGLTGCSEAQVHLHVEGAAACPEASKLGIAEVETDLLHETLKGAVYLATPHQNPFGSLLAGYIVVEGQGIRIKVPGQFEPDPRTGQITTRFTENPQLPFSELKLKLFEGAHGVLRTPAVCDTYRTTTSLTPFSAPESGPPAQPQATFKTDNNGGPCPSSAGAEPNAPRFVVGTETPQAGIYSPLSLRLVRDDGSQEITGIDTTLPPGLTGRLAGIPYCSDAAIATAAGRTGSSEKANPSCPATSEVGTVDIGAGAGPTPTYVAGHAYLAGPYKGAPISLAIITPAVAGPFDLGTVVVRTALYVNPETTQIHAVSDAIPTILEGIPLDVRSITLKMARPNFTLNPTSCEESAFTGSALSVLNVAAPLSERFQVGGCPALAFKPKLSLSLKGGTKRAKNPALTAVLKMPPGGANIAAAQVTLPHSEFLDQGHIKTICTNVQFNANQCPAASVYGHARAITPLLDQPLEGPVYLRSSSHELPDLVADLNGQLQVVLVGRIDSIKGGIRTTFEGVPDAPVSKFVLKMQGGEKGLLENNTNICKSRQRATATFTGHNGKGLETTPLLKVRCGKHHKKHKRNHHRHTLRAAG